MNSEILASLLQNQDLVALVDRYTPSSGTPAEARYPLYAKKLSAKRFVMPVAGVQGSGKSTLLNALAFDRPVLPVDADETTCVPVEIVWSAAPSGQARVVLQNGQEEHVQATEEALKGFVHNEFNPGNEKGVDRIILESAEPIFEPGLVLVDLPGTGSLTAANMETTSRYLDEAVGVLFMLRTVPPLTRSESVFVALQWARLPMAMFIQNRWTDETSAEAENGKEHNVAVLADLAKRNRIPLEGRPEVSVVNAYQAWHGRLSQDASLSEQSGVLTFSQSLGTLAKGWPQQLQEGIITVLDHELIQTQGVIELQLQQLSESREKVEADMAAEHKRFEEYIGKLREKKSGAENDADNFVSQQKAKLAEWSDKSRSELRNTMRTKMRAGIVDGPRLERALREEESVVADDAFGEVEEAIMGFQDKMREKFRGIGEWSATKKCDFETVSRKESTKWESLAPTVLGAGAGFGGGAGGAWAGLEIGLKLGLATGNPIGAIIGGVVGGILGGIIGCWTGSKTRETVIAQRAKAVEGEVFRVIDNFVSNLSDSLFDQAKSFKEHLLAAISAWEKEQVARFERERAKTIATLAASQEERAQMRELLERDLAAVTGFQNILNKEGF